MTKLEFMNQLASELHKRNIADAADVLEEYEQHFAFKLSDGYSEEEIAARLGSPADLAAQFESAPQGAKRRSAALTWLWLGWLDVFFGLFAILLLAFGIVLARLGLVRKLKPPLFPWLNSRMPSDALHPKAFYFVTVRGLYRRGR